jgi:uncharacterized protein YndB with AHSA1/START domain
MPTVKSANRSDRIGDEAVRKATGKTWKQWFALLDRAGANQWDHKRIVAHIHENHGVGPWWQQMVTVAYEQERGLRAKHEKPGGFQISRSRTIAAPAAALFAAFEDSHQRARWLKDPDVSIRKATPNKSMRVTWVDDKTTLEVNFYPKGREKTQVVVQHGKLPTSAAAERMKTYWEHQLSRLERAL